MYGPLNRFGEALDSNVIHKASKFYIGMSTLMEIFLIDMEDEFEVKKWCNNILAMSLNGRKPTL
ncbi:unnamed protein product [Prunus brigantina]